jgi:hypothetical protein
MSSEEYKGDIVLLPTGNDILTLTRVIQGLQDKLQKTANDLEISEHDAEQYRKWWLEERENTRNLAKAGDRLRRVDPMQNPCPLTEEWDKACTDAGVYIREDDDNA